MTNQYLGVDPGRSGALALINGQNVPQVWDMPGSKVDRGCDIMSLFQILEAIPSPEQTMAALEWNTARPGEVPDYAFRFGLQTGQLHAALYAYSFQIITLAPNKWTGRLGLPGKTHAGAIEQRAAMWDSLYPAFKSMIRGPRGGILDGRLDALLIAVYIRKGGESVVGWKGGRRPPTFRGVGISDLL